MKKIFLLLSLFGLIFTNNAIAIEFIAKKNNEVKALEENIFIVEMGMMKKVNIVPYKVGQIYGWTLKLNTSEKLNITEEFILPSSAPNWQGFDLNHKVTDNKVSVLKTVMIPKNGIIMNAYGIAEEDPKGMYTFNILVNNKLLKSFKFLVN